MIKLYSFMSFAIVVAPSSRRRRHGSLLLTLRRLRCTVSWKVAVLLLFFVQISPAFYCGMIKNVDGGTLIRHHDRHRLLAMDGEAVGGSQTGVSVTVKRSARNPVDVSQLSGCGSTFYASGYDDNGNKDGLVLMQTLSGILDDGREVLAFVRPGKYPPGMKARVEECHVVDKPKILDWERAAMLPFLAVSCLWPLSMAGFDASMAAGQTFVVTGSHGSLAPFVVAVLTAWGGKVAVATTKKEGAVRALGENITVVDFRRESYSEVVQGDFSAVVDTLGRENEGAQSMLKEARGAVYVSLQPSVLKVAVEEGVLFGAGKILQYQKTVAKDDSRTFFLPNAEAVGLVSQVSALVSSRHVKLDGVGSEYVGMQEYLEALAWPKDADTGLRYGFPGKTNRSWGWLGGDSLSDELPWEEEDEQDEDGGEGEEGGGGVPNTPTGEVVGVKSEEELRALVGEGGTMVFVSSRSCRACKYLTPFYRKLARRQENILFGRVDASSHPELARHLGLQAVPAFVTFREGEVVTSTATSSKKKIEKLVDELLLPY